MGPTTSVGLKKVYLQQLSKPTQKIPNLSLSLPWIQASGGFKLFVGAVEAAAAAGEGGIQASI
jgi:hypothetical protein